MSSPASSWLLSNHRSGASRSPVNRLICFPPAGTGIGFFRNWHTLLPHQEIVPVQLPGRDGRFTDPPIDNAHAIAKQVADAILAEKWESPLLLGYSFGALLAFETTRILEEKGIQPQHLIVCARSAPQTSPRQSLADLPEETLLDYVRKLGGLPKEIEMTPEFIDIFLPIMRSDFRANEDFACSEEVRINAPITVFNGRHDQIISNGNTPDWDRRTRNHCQQIEIDGGHFFIHDQPNSFFEQLSKVVRNASSRRQRNTICPCH
ncbi:MAG: thioesterase domain-containing protein [Candidatus Thiodiazotropha sp.]|jgi:medium-chain acyl-[acyl-carrier-protein] hydrolase